MPTDKEDGGLILRNNKQAKVPMLEARPKALTGHLDTLIISEETDTGIPEYRPTYPFSEYIDALHPSLAHCKIKEIFLYIHT